MTELKCPFCQKKLEIDHDITHSGYCKKCDLYGDEQLWQELIHTRKALEIAVGALREIGFGKNINIIPDDESAKYINLSVEALEQITALEQKDK